MSRAVIRFSGTIFADEVTMEPGPAGTTYFLTDARTKHYLGECQAVYLAPILFAAWRNTA